MINHKSENMPPYEISQVKKPTELDNNNTIPNSAAFIAATFAASISLVVTPPFSEACSEVNLLTYSWAGFELEDCLSSAKVAKFETKLINNSNYEK